MRYFVDTEFHERGPKHPIELISIGILAEDGREFYACNRDYDDRKANDWLRMNVLSLLPPKPSFPFPYHGKEWMRYSDIAPSIFQFVGGEPPEFWGYYCAYDYVVLSQLMGGMEKWPLGWPYLMRDLRVLLDDQGMSHVRQPNGAPHDALEDARWVQRTYSQIKLGGGE